MRAPIALISFAGRAFGLVMVCCGGTPAVNPGVLGSGSAGSGASAHANDVAGADASVGPSGNAGSEQPARVPDSGSSIGDEPGGGSSAAEGGTTAVPTGGRAPSAQFLPKVSGTCPAMKTGTATFMGQTWQLWVGPGGGGPLIIYWHGTSSSSVEAPAVLGQQTVDAVMAQGGLVAAPGANGNGSTGQGTNTGDNVWYTGDFDMADQVVACAIDQLHIDTRRIYAAGGSAGGLQSAWQSYARSGYTAAVAPVSGGMTGIKPFWLDPVTMPQDPTNVPSAILTHGAEGQDVVVEDFAEASAAYEADVKSKGGYTLDCNTQGAHMSGPPQISPAIWQFFQDHPFGVKTPYGASLPSVFPGYCKTGPRLADGGAP